MGAAFGRYPFHQKLPYGTEEQLQEFLNSGDDLKRRCRLLRYQDKLGSTALHYYAAVMQHFRYIEMIINSIDIASDDGYSLLIIPDNYGRTLLHYSTDVATVQLIQQKLSQPQWENLVSRTDKQNRTCLHIAALYLRLAVFGFVLDSIIEPGQRTLILFKTKDSNAETPISILFRQMHSWEWEYKHIHHKNIVKMVFHLVSKENCCNFMRQIFREMCRRESQPVKQQHDIEAMELILENYPPERQLEFTGRDSKIADGLRGNATEKVELITRWRTKAKVAKARTFIEEQGRSIQYEHSYLCAFVDHILSYT